MLAVLESADLPGGNQQLGLHSPKPSSWATWAMLYRFGANRGSSRNSSFTCAVPFSSFLVCCYAASRAACRCSRALAAAERARAVSPLVR